MILAIDFDGTIVEHRYPAIGRIRPFAFETLKALQKKNHRIILWTHRSGDELDEAVSFCRENGLEFYAVNKNYPEEKWNEKDSRKILADIYIDDRNLGGLPSWGEIFKLICPEEDLTSEKTTKPWWKR
ncbi:MAG: hydrolase [Prolixibacteraceae bacterium]|nr:hydrolase [Prolixibacteraceae bacterium]